MYIYKISQYINDYHDVYNSAIVAAESVEEARLIHPMTPIAEMMDGTWTNYDELVGVWARPEEVQVELIGLCLGAHRGVILASFRAG